jgi:hypothetical protein
MTMLDSIRESLESDQLSELSRTMAEYQKLLRVVVRQIK